jgi:hypothetical protein
VGWQRLKMKREVSNTSCVIVECAHAFAADQDFLF